MAKKQTIILTHGSGAPVYSKDNYKKGEVLVRHAGDAKDAALYTANNDEDGWIEFPSKAYVDAIDAKITSADGINKKLEALNTSVEALVAEDAEIRGEFAAADAELDGKITALDTAYKAADEALTAEIAKKADSTTVNGIDGRLATAEGEIDDLQAADTAIRGELAAADTQIRTDFAAADTALEGRLNAEIAKKANTETVNGIDGRLEAVEGSDAGKSMRTVAKEEVDTFKELLYGEGTADVIDTLQDVINWIGTDESGATKIVADIAELQRVTSGYAGEKAIQTVVNGIDGRLTTAEGEIDDLQAADTAIRGEFAAADTQIRTDFAAADTALEGRLNTEIAKKADSTTVNGIDGRLTTAEGEIDDLQAADTAIRGEFAAADTQIRTDFAAADTALEGRLNAEIAKKANTETVNGIDERLEAVEEAYVKEVEIIDTETNIAASVASNKLTLDFSDMVIDGGTY